MQHRGHCPLQLYLCHSAKTPAGPGAEQTQYVCGSLTEAAWVSRDLGPVTNPSSKCLWAKHSVLKLWAVSRRGLSPLFPLVLNRCSHSWTADCAALLCFPSQRCSTGLWRAESASAWGQLAAALQKWGEEESLNPFVLRALCKIHLFFSTVYKRQVTHIASFHYAGFFYRNDPCSHCWKEWFQCINVVADDYFGTGSSNIWSNHQAAFLHCYLFSVRDYCLQSRDPYSLSIQSQPG